jgi:CubicO group peptidase (beta-lactamase class C family)
MLVEKGALSWDTAVGAVFPDLKAKSPDNKGFNATITHLLCHHGGIKEISITQPSFDGLVGTEWRRHYLETTLADASNPGPGETSIYGPGPIIAVAMAEKLTGKSFEALFLEHLGKPLGIRSFAMGRASSSPIGWWFGETEKQVKPAADSCNSYIGNDPGGGICLSMADMIKVHSLRLGIAYPTPDGGTLSLSRKTRNVLNTAPWAAQDGAALGGWYESDLDTRWLVHGGNTGCGDWSRISMMRDGDALCFYHMNCNRPGNDSRTPFDWRDFSTRLRRITLETAQP